ncbi:hypothetical protein PR048_018251 [Dryococelus australis]|uniref:Uncharacterized protein n=1 Tax=Dryococelus australis TaxID=614101 RepID=A0ABQ9HBX0_9NEOP|nr:hypothetical protein PR048_018251 [Dryococelus australis]
MHENELACHYRDLNASFYELAFNDLRRLAIEYAEAYNIVHMYNKESRLVGKDWALTFMKKIVAGPCEHLRKQV